MPQKKLKDVEKWIDRRVMKLFSGRRIKEFDAIGTVTEETAGFVKVNWDEGFHPYRRPLVCSKKELEFAPDDRQLTLPP